MLLGMEIGASRLKIAEMKEDSLSRFSTVYLPDDIVRGDALIAFDAMSEFLKENAKKKFKTNKVALVLPDSATYVRRLNMPAMTEAQLKVNLPYEFHDVISDDKAGYLFDYSVIEMHTDSEGKPTTMDLMASAVSKELIEQYQDMFRHAGMKLVKAAPRIMALGALAHTVAESATAGDFAVLDLGHSGTRVDIFHDGVYEVTRSIDIGIHDVVTAAADVLSCDPHIAREYLVDNQDNVLESEECKNVYSSIAVEVMRAINYYTYENRDNNLENLYFCGGGSWIHPLMQELANTIPLKLVSLSELSEEYDVSNALTDGPCAVGICLE